MAFEAILNEERARPRGFWRGMLITSVALHVAALVAGVVHSIWQVEEMPMPSLEVTLTAAVAPPPPPPPPPARKKSADSRPKTKPQPRPQEIVTPTEVTKDIKPPEDTGAEDGQSAGQVGGVEGGVEGGGVGGVVGAPPPPPPPKPTGPKNVSAKVARGQLLIAFGVDRWVTPLAPNWPWWAAAMGTVVGFLGEIDGRLSDD
jgi:hypothetical protein